VKFPTVENLLASARSTKAYWEGVLAVAIAERGTVSNSADNRERIMIVVPRYEVNSEDGRPAQLRHSPPGAPYVQQNFCRVKNARCLKEFPVERTAACRSVRPVIPFRSLPCNVANCENRSQ
jgi:hypothetical protein